MYIQPPPHDYSRDSVRVFGEPCASSGPHRATAATARLSQHAFFALQLPVVNVRHDGRQAPLGTRSPRERMSRMPCRSQVARDTITHEQCNVSYVAAARVSMTRTGSSSRGDATVQMASRPLEQDQESFAATRAEPFVRDVG